MPKIIYGGLIKDRIKHSIIEDEFNKRDSKNTLVANAIAKTKKTTRKVKPVIYGDLYNKRIKESEKEDFFNKRVSQLAYAVRDGRRRAEQPQREGVILPGQVANKTPIISAITREMINEYHEAEKLKPIIIDGEIRKYEKALYQPNLTFDEEIESTDGIDRLLREYGDEKLELSKKFTDVDREIISATENIKQIKNEIDETGGSLNLYRQMRQETQRIEQLKKVYKELEKDIDFNNIRVKNLKDAYDKVIKHNADVGLKNREEVLKYEQSLNTVNRNRLNLQQQPNETEYEYYNRLREIEKEKYDPLLYKKYAENEQTKTLKTNLNSLFDNTGFREEILSHIPPEDKFVINKNYNEIGEAFLEKYGYNNKTINSKTAADALLLLSSVFKNEAASTLQAALKRISSGKILQGKITEANRADEIQQQITDRERRITEREEKALEKKLRREYEQTQKQAEKTEAASTLQSAIKRLGLFTNKTRANEKQQQIADRERRIIERERKANEKALEKQLRHEYEQTQKQAEQTEAARGKIGAFLQSRADRELVSKLRKHEAGEKIAQMLKSKADRDIYANTIKKVRGYENIRKLRRQQAFNELMQAVKEQKDWQIFESLAKPADVEHTYATAGISPLQQAENRRIEDLINESIENEEAIELDEKIQDLESRSELSEADTILLQTLRKRRSDIGKRRMPYRTRRNVRAAKVIENAILNKKARKEMKSLREEKQAKGHGLKPIRARQQPKRRVVKTSKTDTLKNRLFLITSEIKAGNDNPKLIVEMDKLYKELYGIENAHLHFKR